MNILSGMSVIEQQESTSRKAQGVVLSTGESHIILRGPVVQCSIAQAADVVPYKLLNDAFLFDSFGSMLCQITIKGVAYWTDTQCTDRAAGNKLPTQLYKQYSIAYPKNAHKRLTIRMGGIGPTYKCVLTGIRRVGGGDSMQKGPPLKQSYTLILLGVAY